MDTIRQDIRYALRQFLRRPAFTAIAVLSLAIGIGGNSLIYGLIDGYVLHPFPYPDPDRLVSVGVTFPKLSSETRYVEVLSPAEYEDIKTSQTFAHTAAFDLGNRNVSGGDVPERVFTALLVDDLFPVIGMTPALGRGFTRDEFAPNGPRVAIISHRLWHSRFGADPGILSRTIRIGGETAAIVGVMPPGLVLIGTDLWLPWPVDTASIPRNRRQFTVLARLAPGVSMEQANAELSSIAARVQTAEAARYKEYEGWRLTATPWAAALMQDIRTAAFLLLGAIALVLLIACANLTNLFLARSTTRQRELAVRLALGAARWRLARHLLTETLLLALAGAAAGLLLTYFGLKAASALIPSQFQMLGLEAGVSQRVLWWSLGLAIASGLLVGLLPALQAARTDPHDSLKSDGRAGAGRSGRRLRQALVVGEIALAVVVLLGAGLLIRSFARIQRIDPGFDARGVLTMRLTLPRERYQGERINAFFDALLERIAAVRGVRAASAASQFPPLSFSTTEFVLEKGNVANDSLPTAVVTVATPGHFDTLRVPMRRGRTFTAADGLNTPPVAVVNHAFANRYFQGADPIGQRVRLGSPDRQRPWTTIVGVVADFRNSGATQPVRPEIFTPVHQQTDWNQLFVLVRGEGSPGALLPSVREAVMSVDAEQPIYAIQTLDEAIALSSFQQRIAALLLGIFAAVALALAAIGIYGVMSYSVSARIQEIGVRLAVGAQRGQVMWLILRQVLTLAAAGLAVGIAALLALGTAMQGLLYGVRPSDPITIAAVAAALGLVALAAAWSPAWRASRVDPIDALRYE
jgi:putative ABC transport system permease protein